VVFDLTLDTYRFSGGNVIAALVNTALKTENAVALTDADKAASFADDDM
jgi:hypothetical protein